jgi:hypothetical protein
MVFLQRVIWISEFGFSISELFFSRAQGLRRLGTRNSTILIIKSLKC